MGKDDLFDPPRTCPITGEPLVITELASEESGVTIRGRFRLPMTAKLDEEQKHFLEVFLRSRGVISTMEKELGISYPTVKSRFDHLLEALGLEPYKESPKKEKDSRADVRRKILKQLEEGKISPEEAKKKLKGVAS